jgi:hypothetical protein
MNISTLKTTVIGSLLFGLTSGVPAEAALMVLSQSAEVNLDSSSVLFQIEFNREPDFFTTDEYDRQADAFQYFIDADGGFPIFKGTDIYYSNLESLIRGSEIHLGGDVRIRNALPPDPDMSVGWGGWGSIRGSVPYTLSGNVLSLLVPLQLIGDTDGKFSYELMWTEYGGMQGYIQAETVPEPATIFGSFMALGGLAAFQRKNKQLKGLRSRGR